MSADFENASVPYAKIAPFVRQLMHDVRNGLNAVDLQVAFISEIATDPEVSEELKRLREITANTAKGLQQISVYFRSIQLNPVGFSAKMLFEDYKERLAKEFPEQVSQLEWQIELGEEMVEVDHDVLTSALRELFRNAFQFKDSDKPIAFRIYVQEGKLVLELTEEKLHIENDPRQWGEEPFTSTRRGAYGLGLFYAKRVIAAHKGEWHVEYNEENHLLKTRLFLPLQK